MKKAVFALILIMLASSGVHAAGVAGKFLVTPHGSVGIGMFGGQLPDVDDPFMHVGLAYNAGLSVGYAPINAGAIMFGAEYSAKPMVYISRDSLYGDYTTTVFASFVDILLGWRGYVKWFYYEAGIFLGIKVQQWERHVKFEDKNYNQLFGGTFDVNEERSDNDFGIYLGLGASIPVTGYLRIDLGLCLEAAFTPAYENAISDAALTTCDLLFKAGMTFMI